MRITADARPGSTLAQRYLVEELVGVGAMGSVYRGRHVALDRIVALKTMHPHFAAVPEMVQRFTAEARVGARLNHENVVTIYDFGFSAITHEPSEPPFIVMEFLAGPSLASTLPYTRLSPVQAGAIAQQLLAALNHAHLAGVVHRDVSPSNVILEPRPGGEVCKLIDFGVARHPSARQALTEPGRVIGAPQYMAPEQVQGHSATFASDLYSAGAVLYEMLTGKRPFDADSIAEVLELRKDTRPLDPIAAAPDRDIPDVLADVVRRATDPDPARRYSSARVFSRALGIALTVSRSSDAPSMDARRSIYPEPANTPAPIYNSRQREEELNAGAQFRHLLSLERQAVAASEREDGSLYMSLLYQGLRAASAMYTAGQQEVGASAACKFAFRACDRLESLGEYEDAKSVLGMVLQLLVRQEPARADILRRLSQLEQRYAGS